jgi:hypothetical protein
MKGTEAIVSGLNLSLNVIHMFLADLSDEDLLVRPVDGANHIAWQLGHLIVSETKLNQGNLPDAKYPALPAGFDVQHSAASAASTTGFGSKAVYLDLLSKVRAATVAAIQALSDADLDRPTQGPMAAFAPRLGDLLNLMANHTMMHGGQFSVVRRRLGKPVIF